MTDVPSAVQQQIDDFRQALEAQPQILASFDALIPRLIDAIAADAVAQETAAVEKLPLGGVAAGLIRGAIDSYAEQAKAEAHAWLDQNLPGAPS